MFEDRTGHPSMGMAATVGVNESLQVQRKLDGFLAPALNRRALLVQPPIRRQQFPQHTTIWEASML